MLIISEIGLNHLGDVKIANNMVNELLDTNTEAITFQIREEGYYDNLKPHHIKLPNEFYFEISKIIKNNNKKFGITIAGTNENLQGDLIDFLFKKCNVDFFKILSYSSSQYKFIETIYNLGAPVYLSLGLSDKDNISYLKNRFPKTIFIYTNLSRNIEDCNLYKINEIKNINENVAYGLHCDDPIICYISLAFNIHSIFFYVKLDSEKNYPDNQGLIINNIDNYISKIKLYQKSIKN
jgi:sialic acid synthase SpsE